LIFLLQNLGFVINIQKSQLEPGQEIEFLGVIVNSSKMELTLPSEKVEKILNQCEKLLSQKVVSILELTKLLGKLTSSAVAVLAAPLHYRKIQRSQINALWKSQSYHTSIVLSEEVKLELKWWLENLKLSNGKSLLMSEPDLVMSTDASKKGWGVDCQGQRTGGPWNQEESGLHINILELKAALLGIKTYTMNHPGIRSVHLQMDNTSALAYIAKMGGTQNKVMIDLSRKIWEYLISKGIMITVEYLPGKLNVSADWESRNVQDSSEWRLDHRVFNRICQAFGTPHIDLFASRVSHQIPCYVSWKPDPCCQSVDAFQTSWEQNLNYAFPPFCLIGRVLDKLAREQAEMILVTPLWQGQPWYPRLLQMCVQPPLLVQSFPTLLLGPQAQLHPLMKEGSLNLAVWRVSGKPWKQKAFRARQQSLYQIPEEKVPSLIMNRPGENGLAGLVNDKLIPLHVLCL